MSEKQAIRQLCDTLRHLLEVTTDPDRKTEYEAMLQRAEICEVLAWS
jgi:hypothetical protein